MDESRALQQESRAIWATVVCFVLGTAVGTAALQGTPRPIAGDGSVGLPAGLIAGAIAAASFAVSTFLHRRGDSAPMPRWQAVVSAASAVALTIALAGVTALGVLLGGEVLGVGLRGVALPAFGGGLLTGVASAFGGRFAFGAGVGLQTRDLASLLFSYLVIGTLFAMLTAADPRWWELNFSQLGIGDAAWVFNGTLMVAGLLVGTVGAYIGRDLHRLRGDAALPRVGLVVGLWAASGAALAMVGLFPLEQSETVHNIAALSTLALFLASAVVTTLMIPGRPTPLRVVTWAIVVLFIVAFVLANTVHLFSITVLEVIVVGLGLLWITTLVRVLAVLAPESSRASARHTLLHG